MHNERCKMKHEQQKLVNLALVASDLDGDVFVLHIDDFRPENIADLHHFSPRAGIDSNAHEHQFTVDKLVVPEVLDGNHINELVELFSNLLKDRVIATHDYCHAGGGGVEGRPHIECINVETTATEHAGDASEHAELVLDQYRDRMSHKEKAAKVEKPAQCVKS